MRSDQMTAYTDNSDGPYGAKVGLVSACDGGTTDERVLLFNSRLERGC